VHKTKKAIIRFPVDGLKKLELGSYQPGSDAMTPTIRMVMMARGSRTSENFDRIGEVSDINPPL
jgi:hypothetical protein